MIVFGSDNMAPAAPEILSHLAAVNDGPAYPYGDDEVTARVTAKLQEVFETDCSVFPVTTGTIANCTMLAAMTPPWGAVLCHELSHLYQDESTGPELMTGGARLVPLKGPHAKLTAETVDTYLRYPPGHGVHHPEYTTLALTQLTELGTVYTLEELEVVTDIAHSHGLKVHLDGARFANALSTLGCSPAEMSWKIGIDSLSFGATKNGCMAAEAILVFNRAAADPVPFLRKRSGHLWSKMRYVSAQLEAYLADDNWLKWAANANAMATRLRDGLVALEGVREAAPCQGNELFVHLPDSLVASLKQKDIELIDWPVLGRDAYRLVCAWCTTEDEVDAFLAAASGA